MISQRRCYNSFTAKYKSSTPRWEKRLHLHLEKHRTPAPPKLAAFETFTVLPHDSFEKWEQKVKTKSTSGTSIAPSPSVLNGSLSKPVFGCGLGSPAVPFKPASKESEGGFSTSSSSGESLSSSSSSTRGSVVHHVVSEKTTPKTINPFLGSVRTGFLAYKMGMMSLYDAWGRRHAVTVAHCDRLKVLGKRTLQSHGYSAVQVGMGYKAVKRQRKGEIGYFMKSKSGPKDKVPALI